MNLSGLHRKFVLNGRDTMDPNRVNGPTQLLSLGYIWESVPGIDTDGVSDANANQGTKTFIYVKNSSGSEITPGLACIRTKPVSVSKTYEVQATGQIEYSGACVGICVIAIADGEYGFLQRSGLIEDLIDTNALTETRSVELMGGVSPHYSNAGNGILGIGYTLVSDATNGAIFLDCRG